MVKFLNYNKRLIQILGRNVAVLALLGASILPTLITGCDKQDTIELVNNDAESQALELEDAGKSRGPLDPGVQDSTGYLITPSPLYYGTLIVAGSEFDGPHQHHETSLAQAAFYDSSRPIVVNGTTVGFRSVGAGNVSIDNIFLHNFLETVMRPDMVADTLGVQYRLLTRDGIGDNFEYLGGHAYTWTTSGDSAIAADTETVLSPLKLRVFTPSAEDVVSLSSDMRVRWSGGGASIRVVICDVENSQNPTPLLRFRLKTNTGGVIIPAELLQLLPQGRTTYLFTFSSDQSTVTHISGFHDKVLVRASSIHNLLLQVRE